MSQLEQAARQAVKELESANGNGLNVIIMDDGRIATRRTVYCAPSLLNYLIAKVDVGNPRAVQEALEIVRQLLEEPMRDRPANTRMHHLLNSYLTGPRPIQSSVREELVGALSGDVPVTLYATEPNTASLVYQTNPTAFHEIPHIQVKLKR